MTDKTLDLTKTYLGIECGSTRIKAVLIDSEYNVVATGVHDWENRLENGIWTYSQEDIFAGVKDCYRDLKKNVKEKYGQTITTLGAIGISGMMHGYLAFDKEGRLLTPFRTWRNTNARDASAQLTELFNFNIPERWSISHLYQSILNNDEHVHKLDYICTLSGYIHRILTGNRYQGIGDAVGMFPIDPKTNTYVQKMVDQFDEAVASKNYSWKLLDILPKVMVAGENAGTLTEEGARFLDEDGDLKAGIVLCPPEGDAGTGMVATNSVKVRTGNISAGTSIFAMIVLEKALDKLHREIDMVTTPDGHPVAMAHANNCTSDLNAWVSLFAEFLKLSGHKVDMNEVFSLLYNNALTGDADCGGLLSYGYYSGEFITDLEEGRPLFVRKPDANFNLANFMRSHLYSSLGATKMGMDILIKDENVKLDSLLGHGGLFKTRGVGQQIMADAMNVPVSVMETASEGGPWGIAILASYVINSSGLKLDEFLSQKVFNANKGTTLQPNPEGVKGFEKFMEDYKNGLAIERQSTLSF